MSGRDSIFVPVSQFLDRILSPLVIETKSFIEDTDSLPECEEEDILVTWDVNSLYTSIPQKSEIDASIELINEDGLYSLAQIEFIEKLLTIILKNNNFLFQDVFVQQRKGVAMGSNVAPSFACSFMHSFEKRFIYENEMFVGHCLVMLYR